MRLASGTIVIGPTLWSMVARRATGVHNKMSLKTIHWDGPLKPGDPPECRRSPAGCRVLGAGLKEEGTGLDEARLLGISWCRPCRTKLLKKFQELGATDEDFPV